MWSSPPEVRPQPSPGPLGSPRNRTLLLALLLAVATVALYYPVHSHPFVNYDDGLYVTENDQVQAGVTWLTVKWAFTTFDVGTWHPLTWLSHALDCQLFGLDPERASRYQPAPAYAECRPAVLGAASGDGIRRTQRHGGGAVCAASHQR